MNDRPTGTVTFLFSDIEGSTQKWEKDAELMQTAFARQESIMQEAMADHGGYVYKMIGDAFQVAFSTAREALEAALAAQHKLQDEVWGEIGALKVRMALHTGVVEERGQDYVGPILNRAARLMSAGHGGQVLISQSTFELLRDDLPAEVSILDLGEYRLKDLTRSERIYQAGAQGLQVDFPPLTTLDAQPNNLPQQLTRFVGREREIVEIEQLLESHRLITIYGPGGAGKTRLALKVAENNLDRFSHGIFFVDLAPISDPLFVDRTIAETLSIRETASQPLFQSITNYLGEKNLLLVLDNFEQVIETAPLVSDLLSAAPALKVIVTSRQPLMISGEQEHPLPPMDVPDVAHLEDTETVSQYESVELFINRAQSVNPGFEISAGNAQVVAEICARLDGLPLAIELAAARIRTLSPAQLLSRLQTRLSELRTGMRDLPARQQTLNATIDWSYNLLSESEKELFTKLSVFQGGRTFEAAEAVCAPGLNIDVMDGMESLAGQSLLYIERGLDGEPRFMMLETIHAYARQKLNQHTAASHLKGLHADYFLDLVEQSEDEFRGSNQDYWSAKLNSEIDNLRTAMSWSFSAGDPQVGIRMAGALRDFWWFNGKFGEGWNWTKTALEFIEQAAANYQAKLYKIASHMAYYYLGDYERGMEWADRALTLYRNLGDERNMGWAKIIMAFNLIGHQDGIIDGIKTSEEALHLFRKHEDLPGIIQSLTVIGELTRMQGDYERAEKVYLEALETNTETGDKYREALTLLNLAYVAHHNQDYQQEEDLIKQALKLKGEFRTPYFTALCLDALASPIGATGEPRRAAVILGATQALLDSMGIDRQAADQFEVDLVLDSVHEQLDDETFAQAWQVGQTMSPEQAIRFALGEEHS